MSAARAFAGRDETSSCLGFCCLGFGLQLAAKKLVLLGLLLGAMKLVLLGFWLGAVKLVLLGFLQLVLVGLVGAMKLVLLGFCLGAMKLVLVGVRNSYCLVVENEEIIMATCMQCWATTGCG